MVGISGSGRRRRDLVSTCVSFELASIHRLPSLAPSFSAQSNPTGENTNQSYLPSRRSLQSTKDQAPKQEGQLSLSFALVPSGLSRSFSFSSPPFFPLPSLFPSSSTLSLPPSRPPDERFSNSPGILLREREEREDRSRQLSLHPTSPPSSRLSWVYRERETYLSEYFALIL